MLRLRPIKAAAPSAFLKPSQHSAVMAFRAMGLLRLGLMVNNLVDQRASKSVTTETTLTVMDAHRLARLKTDTSATLGANLAT